MGLNQRQKAFVREYAVDRNATRAYERAGYKPDPSGARAARLIGQDRIRRAIDRKLDKLAEKTELNAEWVLRQFRERAEDEDEIGATRIRAAELVGKHLGLFVERQEVTVKTLGDAIDEAPHDP